MSRNRLFALIDSFENDMRDAVSRFLLPYHDEQALLATDFEAAQARKGADPAGADVSAIYYLDLRPCYDLLLRNRKDVPVEFADELSANAQFLEVLAPIRNRVMHGRPLHPEDPEATISALSVFRSRQWLGTAATLDRLRADAVWEPAFHEPSGVVEKILHNLPEADYDETGLVGRGAEAKKLIQALETGRDNVITITGEGGIGKTALALDIAYQLLDRDTNPFDAILWVSLKTEKLTASGVEILSDAIQGIDESIAELSSGLSGDFNKSVKDLADALDGIKTLIIIDNLESAQGSEIIALYEALPDSVRYLFTSRLGIGELERRYPLLPLAASEAKRLFRMFASKRGQKGLAGLSDKTLDEVVVRLRFSPLAIRWYILSAEAGKVPTDIIHTQQELLDFCVKNVYDGLRGGSQAVLSVLRALDRSIGFDEFAVLTDIPIDDLRSATQELTRGSLVNVEPEVPGAVSGRLGLTPTARAFLAREDRSGTFIVAVLQRERQYKAMLEERIAERRNLDAGIVRPRTDADNPSVHLLRSALRLARAGKLPAAREQVERARNFNPEFSESYRVAGDLYVLEEAFEPAVSEYQNALSYAQGDATVATTAFLLADVMGRRLHDASLALPYAEQAYALWATHETAFLLGRFKVWTGQYASGQELLEEALINASRRQELMVTTVIIDSWGRWGEAEWKDRNPAEAINKATAGFHLGRELLRRTPSDRRILDATLVCCVAYLKALNTSPTLLLKEKKRLDQVARFLRAGADGARVSKKGTYVRDAIRSLLKQSTLPFDANMELTRALELMELVPTR
ncbi:ATP-binding protein [Clavibacter zhangzhiyongii]|uniref:ATP-binding protein n=1 Tax=Clavibacter zhangzhiyongii TaxID=2768071 RepID=UPI0019577BEA|nr:ATP-binding protein [Clavibacter zhangzhiyongii]MBM7025555.1 hypothetical protein [Clavibacter zhangzhiyongii]